MLYGCRLASQVRTLWAYKHVPPPHLGQGFNPFTFYLTGFPSASQFLSLGWAGLVTTPESHPLIAAYRAITESHFLSHKKIDLGLVIQVKLIGVLSGILAGVSGGGLCLLQCEPVNCGLVSPFLGLEGGKAWWKSQGQSQRDDSISNHCHQTCSPEFHPQKLHGRRREATPASLQIIL